MAFSNEFQNILDSANLVAGNLRGDATRNLDNAVRSIERLGYTGPAWREINPPDSPDVGLIPDIPTFSPVGLTLPSQPAQPEALREAPSFDFGTAPVVNVNLGFPEAPDLLIPVMPTFTEREVPNAPEVILPDFEGVMPSGPSDLDDPSNMLDGAEDKFNAYSDKLRSLADDWVRAQSPAHFDQLAKMEAKLDAYLNGGTGIQEEVETAIINRAREQQSRNAEATKQAAYDEAASRGFTLPTGALMSAVARARQEAANNVHKAITDLAVAQMEMEQKNLQFAISTSASLRTLMVNAAISWAGQLNSLRDKSFDFAKTQVSTAIEIHNAAIRTYSARVDAYRTAASVYDTQIKVALSKIDVFRAQIEALKTQTDADQSKVSLYNAQIASLSAISALYQSRVDAAKGRASLEKIKLEIYQAETQAFSSQVQAKNAEWSAYTAQLAGDEAKLRKYTAELQSYNYELDAYQKQIAAKIAEADAVAKENQTTTDRYQAMVQAYTATVDAESKRAMAENENNRQILTAFNAELSAFKSRTEVALAQYTAQADANVKNATGSLSAQVEAARGKLEYGKTLSSISVEVGKTYSSLANTAMSGINTLGAGIINE
jgi:chromosome segregation ATPase